MLKSASGSKHSKHSFKKGSLKPAYIGALESGLNRRAFLRESSIALLVAGIVGCKPDTPKSPSNDSELPTKDQSSENQYKQTFVFDKHQKQTLTMVQNHLFPDDGDGPSANDINALNYLTWALTDPDNQDDGDGDFVVKGIGWLDGLAEQTQGDLFVNLPHDAQQKLLEQIARSSTGENWLSLLVYYLLEALLLDPFYGGNTNGVGWKWLKHQPGFPAPDNDTHYLKFT